jgi:hypothetical protein
MLLQSSEKMHKVQKKVSVALKPFDISKPGMLI